MAYCSLPPGAASLAGPSAPRWDLPLRMALTAALVVSLAAAADRLGPVVGGILAALPVLASVLAVFTREQQGGAAGCALLRGMLSGMAGRRGLLRARGVLVDRAGVAPTFTAAAFAAVAVQAATANAGASPA